MATRPVSTSTGNSRNTSQNNGVVEIDLAELAGAIWKRKGLVIVLTLLGALLALAITVLAIRPTYRSSFTAYVNNHSTNSENNIDTLNNGDTTASQSLAQTYSVIMASRPVVEDALKQAKLSYTYEDVSNCISTSIQTNTQLVTLNVTMQSAEDAKKLADAIADVAPDYIADIVEGSSMKIVSSPVLATSKYSPSISKNTVIGALIGLLLALVIVTVQYLTDDRIHSAADLEKKFGISIMGSIPDFATVGKQKGGYGYYYGRKSGK